MPGTVPLLVGAPSRRPPWRKRFQLSISLDLRSWCCSMHFCLHLDLLHFFVDWYLSEKCAAWELGSNVFLCKTKRGLAWYKQRFTESDRVGITMASPGLPQHFVEPSTPAVVILRPSDALFSGRWRPDCWVDDLTNFQRLGLVVKGSLDDKLPSYELLKMLQIQSSNSQ